MITITANGIDREGRGVGRLEDGRAIFVAGLLPDEVGEVAITSQKKNYAIGRLERVLVPHSQRITPPCPYYGLCGGCHLQHADYPLQLALKARIVAETLQRLGKVPCAATVVRPAISSPQNFNYRNKLTLHTGVVDNRLALGLYAANSAQLVEVEVCLLASPQINATLKELREQFFSPASGKNISIAADEVVIRQGRDGKIVVAIKTKHQPLTGTMEKMQKIAKEAGFALVFLRPEGRPWAGSLVNLVEEYHQISLTLPSTSFAQVNPPLAEKLYDFAITQLGDLAGKQLADLYCGAGATSLLLAQAGAKVMGIELDASAIACAKDNAAANHLSNVKFIAGLAENELPRYLKSGKSFDGVLLDPPRTGLAKPLTEMLAASKIPQILYISCDPATLARDVAILQSGGYQVETAQPFDMFPQTGHVEAIILMTRSGSDEKK